MQKTVVLLMVLQVTFSSCQSQSAPISKEKKIMSEEKKPGNPVYSKKDSTKVNLSNEEWKTILPSEVYSVARQKGTERPFTSKFEKFDEIGTYYCAVCGNALFQSNTKFESDVDGQVFINPSAKVL